MNEGVVLREVVMTEQQAVNLVVCIRAGLRRVLGEATADILERQLYKAPQVLVGDRDDEIRVTDLDIGMRALRVACLDFCVAHALPQAWRFCFEKIATATTHAEVVHVCIRAVAISREVEDLAWEVCWLDLQHVPGGETPGVLAETQGLAPLFFPHALEAAWTEHLNRPEGRGLCDPEGVLRGYVLRLLSALDLEDIVAAQSLFIGPNFEVARMRELGKLPDGLREMAIVHAMRLSTNHHRVFFRPDDEYSRMLQLLARIYSE